MKIKRLLVQNFRSIKHQDVRVNDYTCFVGPNGAGKSNVLAALAVFFGDTNIPGYNGVLEEQDYHCRDTSKPVVITVTFGNLSVAAQADLADYVRQNELTVTAEGWFDQDAMHGRVIHYGYRLGMEDFRVYFEAEKAGQKVEGLKAIYALLRGKYCDLPDVKVKQAMADALRDYERRNSDKCTSIKSEDQFYGINGLGKLARHVQWVFLPAVKDAGDESQEAKKTAFGQLVIRVVRAKLSFDANIDNIRENAWRQYCDLLDASKGGLADLASKLQERLRDWTHPGARLDLEWLRDSAKSVIIREPIAGVLAGDGEFLGDISRMGHGLQRAYLAAILQELAACQTSNSRTLVLACEEPELYQHPPQARHMANMFAKLSAGSDQVLISTHSPLFVAEGGIECVRSVCRASGMDSEITSSTGEEICRFIERAKGDSPRKTLDGMLVKLHQAILPSLAEMFFSPMIVLVEGLEDVAYVTTHLRLRGKWSEFRRLGGHLVWVGGKSRLIEPIAIAKNMNIGVFVVLDSDGSEQDQGKKSQHKQDNELILALLGAPSTPFPSENVYGGDYAIWVNTIGDAVKSDLGDHFERVAEEVRLGYGHEGGLSKNAFYIGELLAKAADDGLYSKSLDRLCDSILALGVSLQRGRHSGAVAGTANDRRDSAPGRDWSSAVDLFSP